MEDAEYSLLIAFHDQSPSFAHGFEAGELFEQMRYGDEAMEAIVHEANRIIIERMATYYGYSASFAPTEVDGWIKVVLTERPESHDSPRANPHGLRLVKTKEPS